MLTAASLPLPSDCLRHQICPSSVVCNLGGVGGLKSQQRVFVVVVLPQRPASYPWVQIRPVEISALRRCDETATLCVVFMTTQLSQHPKRETEINKQPCPFLVVVFDPTTTKHHAFLGTIPCRCHDDECRECVFTIKIVIVISISRTKSTIIKWYNRNDY